MATLRVEGDELVVGIEGFGAKVLALGSEIRLPKSAVVDVRGGAPELMRRGFWLRAFGASLPNVRIGYFWRKNDGLSFVDVRHLDHRHDVVAIDLRGTRLKHVYVEPSTERAADVAERVRRALAT